MKLKDIHRVKDEAILCFNRKKIDDARDKFNDILDIDPTNPEANYYLGLIYTAEKNFQKAVVHLKSIVDKGVNFLFTQQCRMILGYIYYVNYEYDRAEFEYLKVLDSPIDIPQAYTALASIYYKLENKEKALSYAEKGFDLDPYSVNAKNTYAYLLVEYDENLDYAVELIKDALRKSPDYPPYLDSLGWAYFKQGNTKEAKEIIKKALDLSNNNPEIKEHYKAVFANKKQLSEASLSGAAK